MPFKELPITNFSKSNEIVSNCRLLQPFFMVLVALMVLALLLALYMPLFQMGMTV